MTLPSKPHRKKRTKEEGRVSNRVLARARASLIVEKRLRGVPPGDIAEEFNISRPRVHQITKWAEEKGIIEEVRERMQRKTVPKAELIYNEILDSNPADLADRAVQKGYELKLKAARHVSDGLGVFRKTPVATRERKESVDLAGYMEIRARRQSYVDGSVVDGDVRGVGELSDGVDALGTGGALPPGVSDDRPGVGSGDGGGGLRDGNAGVDGDAQSAGIINVAGGGDE